MQTTTLKVDGCKVPVTVLEQFCALNWRVRLEADCTVHGRRLAAGSIYIAGKSQLLPVPPGDPQP